MKSSSKHGRPGRAKTLLVLAIFIVSWLLIEGGYRIYLFVENKTQSKRSRIIWRIIRPHSTNAKSLIKPH